MFSKRIKSQLKQLGITNASDKIIVTSDARLELLIYLKKNRIQSILK